MPRAKQKTAAPRGRPKAAKRRSSGPKAKVTQGKSAGAEATILGNDTASPPPESTALMLPDCLDSSVAAAVKDMLLARRGSALVVDASQVRRVGAQSLQVLISAARTWQSDGQSYRVTNSSSELLDTIALIGLSREDLLLEGTMQ